MIEWGTIVGLLSLGLLVFLLWKEWSRPNRSLLAGRLAATVIAILSLYLLAVPPSYTRKIEQAENQLIILTDGYADDSVRALTGYEKMPSYDLREDKVKGAVALDVDDVLSRHPGRNRIHLFGYGLARHQLEKLKEHSVIFHRALPPEGFASLQYKNELEQGERLQVYGKFVQRDSGKVRIFISHFGAVLDSTWLVDGAFHLTHIPAHIGRAAYSILAVQGKDTLEKQILPLVVHERKIFRVLFLGSAPGFETRFLKDWLVEKGYQVISKTLVSRNAFSKEFVNEDRKGLERINESVLNEMDLVVGDQAALASLSSGEVSFIKRAVAENGMGLMYWVDGETRDLFGIPVSKMPGGEQQKLNLILADSSILKPLKTDNQYQIIKATVQPLVTSTDGKIFAAASQQGRGRVVVSTIIYSHKWSLSGARNDYDRYWTLLLNKALGKTHGERWQIAAEWGLVNSPLGIEVETMDAEPLGIINKQEIYLRNDPADPVRWQGSFWPRRTGWHALENKDQTVSWFYVIDKDAWRSMMINKIIKENIDFVSSLKEGSSELIKQNREENRQVPLIIYAILFMIATGFLWFENKRMGG
jgi:hypothetical protein